MADYLLDTGILIRHLRNYSGYAALTDRLSDEGLLYLASFSRFEVLRGMRDHEQERPLHLLNSFLSLPMDTDVADLAGGLVRAWRERGYMLGEGDAIIAATALHAGLELVTTNPRHFPMPELAVWQADEEGNLGRP